MNEKLTESIDLSRKKVLFFGRIMANVSHEFNNVITVISELAGLLKDLSLMAQKGREIPTEKIISISENISRQVVRGKRLITHMNRFSHSTDGPSATVDLAGTVENMQVLTDRLFKCRRSSIVFSPPAEPYSLDTDPFELRRILFACLERFLDAPSSEVSVTMHRAENGGEYVLQITGQGEPAPPDFIEQLDELKEQAGALHGRLFYEQTGNRIQVRLSLPSNRNGFSLEKGTYNEQR
jgi:signal transduction histidine kinase